MIKKILLSLGLFLFGFIGFSDSYEYKVINVGEELMVPFSSIYSFRPVSSSAGVLIGGGISKPLIYLPHDSNLNSSDIIYYWGSDNELMFVAYQQVYKLTYACLYNSSNYTGFAGNENNGVLRCEGGGQLIYLPDYYSNNNFQGKMTSIALSLEFYALSNPGGMGRFCFIYDSLNTSICVAGQGENLGWLSDFPGLSQNPFDFDVSYIGTSPWVSGGGGSSSGGSSYNTGNFQITNGSVLSTYSGMGFNKNVCYGGALTGVNGQSSNALIPGTGTDIFTVYSRYNPLGFSTIEEWYDYYRIGYADCPKLGGTCEQPDGTFSSPFYYDGTYKVSLFGIFFMGKYYGLGAYPSADIIDYCDLLLNKTTTTEGQQAVYTGYVDESFINYITNSYTYGFLTGGVNSGGVWEVYDIGAISELSGEDLSWSSNDFFSKLSSRFASSLDGHSDNAVGIIPSYILFALFGLIFIRIIRK